MSDNFDFPCSQQWRGYYNNDNSDYSTKEETGMVTHVWLGKLIHDSKTGIYEQQVTVALEEGYKTYDKEQALGVALRVIGSIHIWQGYRLVDATAFRKRGEHMERFWVRYKLQKA